MSERPPVDTETTAASVLNGAMVVVICLVFITFSLFVAIQKIGDLWLADGDRRRTEWGLLASGVFPTFVCARFIWETIKGVRSLPMRKTPAATADPLTREELIRQAPWTGRGPGKQTQPLTPVSVTSAVGLVLLLLLSWRFVPEPYVKWEWLGLAALAAITRLVRLAWSQWRKR